MSLALLGSHHPLPSLQPTKLCIRSQTLLGKRMKKQLIKSSRIESRVIEKPAKFEFQEEVKASIIGSAVKTTVPIPQNPKTPYDCDV